ncbi:MAG: ATP-binding protein [Deltaproteobacteria bacterium]|nr:ATP-binding protein [Myxococcales bacterium]MDP3212580.1 ATP-binding protein [Deltaproteobacteria bacterium]
MHPLLARQLRRLGLGLDAPPADPSAWLSLIERVSESYGDFDRERYMMERSLSISSAELRALYDDLVRDVAERERAEAALRESEAAQRLLCDASPVPVLAFDAATLRIVSANDAAVLLYDYPREALLQLSAADLWAPAERATAARALRAATPEEWRGAASHARSDGSALQVEIVARSLTLNGAAVRMAVVVDVTARTDLEAQLRQAQKMEAVGRLAGGVAHDFNNILSVMLGYADLTVDELEPGTPLHDNLQEIRAAGARAAELTRQLLLFSRHEMTEQRAVDLNELLAKTERMLTRLLGADVELVTALSPALGLVRADPGNLQQVILNLVVNARDAMPTGGRLTIETRNVVLDEQYASAHLGAVVGPYVMLTVTDTGVGMDKLTQSRIFEPFFTTKERGKGTGLGLSTVFGILRQSGGSIWVQSEPGRGTTFTVYLPRVEADADGAAVTPTATSLEGSETILLVEDEAQVRDVVHAILRRAGYRVLVARDGEDALRQSEGFAGPIDLLLTDVVMPRMSGPELARHLAPTRPETAIVCMSGYTDDILTRHGLPDAEVSYLQKPITSVSLTRKVREAIDAAKEPKDGTG